MYFSSSLNPMSCILFIVFTLLTRKYSRSKCREGKQLVQGQSWWTLPGRPPHPSLPPASTMTLLCHQPPPCRFPETTQSLGPSCLVPPRPPCLAFPEALFYFILTSISSIMSTSWGLQLCSGKQHSSMPSGVFSKGVKLWTFTYFFYIFSRFITLFLF